MTLCKIHNREKKRLKDGTEVCELCENRYLKEVWELVHKKNRNALVLVEGPPGCGKSYICLKHAEILDPKFFGNSKITPEELSHRILFRPGRFASVLSERNLYKGAVVIMEEGGIQADHRKWYSFNNMVINYILQTFRFMNLIVLFNVPVIDFVDSDSRKLFNFHVEAIKVDYKKGRNIFKVKKQSLGFKRGSSSKIIYRKYLRFKVGGQWLKFRRWNTKRPQGRLCRSYEKLHQEFKTGLIEDLAKEVSLIDRMESQKQRRHLIDEDAAVEKVLANVEHYAREYGGRTVVDRPTVESDFKIGRAIAERIKKRAERELEGAA